MEFKKYRIAIFLLVALALVFAGVYFYNRSHNDFKLIKNDADLGEFIKNMKDGDLEKYLAKRDELYAQDVYGGSTPEETLQMYIDALKAGDFELASKYFRLEDQEGELGDLKNMSKDKVDTYISVLETYEGKNNYNKNLGFYEFNGVFNDEEVLIAKFSKNEQTGKWKMESIE